MIRDEMATLAVRGISFEGFHGATSPERKLAWRFEVDVEIDADLSLAETRDRLADTIDYSAVCRTVVEVGTGRNFHLIEGLGRAVLDAVAERFPAARAIRLEVRKLNPPRCPGRPEHASVRFTHP
jgi:dihydroneopterin aldolase